MASSRDYAQVSLLLAKLMSEAETPKQLFSQVLELLARSFDWQFAALWRVDYDSLEIVNVATWKYEPSRFSQFDSLSRMRSFYIGQGLPGRVWQQRVPTWIAKLEGETNFPRLQIAIDEGLRCGVGFPVRVGKQVYGMIEMYRSQETAPDEPMLEFLQLVGAQIGLYLERIRAEESLTSAESQYRVLAEQAIDPIVTINEGSIILFVNRSMVKLFGYREDELVGSSLTIIIPERLRRRHEEGMRRYIQSGERKLSWDGIVLPALHQDGHEFNVEIRFGEFYRGPRRLFSGYIRRVE